MTARVWLAEFIGTFALVFAGIAAIAAGAGSLATAAAFGLSVTVMIAAVGPISFAHFNPAVTVGFLMLGRINFRELLLYWSAELSGAVAAILALQLFLGPERLAAAGYGATSLAPGISLMQGIIIEVTPTFFLMFVIASCVLQERTRPGIYIGLTVALGSVAGGAFTGASMDPARSFAPALLANLWTDHWLYWLAPILGALLAAVAASHLWRSS